MRTLSPRQLLFALFASSLALSFVAVGDALVAGAVFADAEQASAAAMAWATALAVLASLQYLASRILRRRPRSAFVLVTLAATAVAALAMLAVAPVGILPLASLAVVGLAGWTWRAQARAAGG